MTLQAAQIEEKIKTSKHPTVVNEKAQGQDCTELLWSKHQMQSKTIKGGSSQQLRKKTNYNHSQPRIVLRILFPEPYHVKVG